MSGAGISLLFRTQGQAVELVEKGEQPAGMTAVLEPESSVNRKDSSGWAVVRERKVTITKDPAGEFGGAEDPQENATLYVGDVQYAVTARHDAGEAWELVCRRIGRRERSRPGLRTQ
jgi:hypothetical protein